MHAAHSSTLGQRLAVSVAIWKYFFELTIVSHPLELICSGQEIVTIKRVWIAFNYPAPPLCQCFEGGSYLS